jgi:hypothetical protein
VLAWDVLVDVELELLVMELVVEEVVLLTIDDDVVTTLDVDVAVVAGGPPSGGSKWNINPSDSARLEPLATVVPTRNPSVPEFRNILSGLPTFVKAMLCVVTQLHPNPDKKCPRIGWPFDVSCPVAQASELETG